MVTLKEVAPHFKEDHLTRPLIKYFYYWPSVYFSLLAIKLRMHAHAVNICGLIAAFVAAGIIWYLDGLWLILAAVLIAFGLVIDLSDGTVARYYNKKNAMGKWLDESSGFIGFCLIFAVVMFKEFLATNELGILVLGTYTIFSYMMINYAALLSEVLRKKFELANPVDKVRGKMSKKLKVNPGSLAFSLDIQWTVVALGVAFNQPYIMLGIFAVLSSIQWMARYIVFWGK